MVGKNTSDEGPVRHEVVDWVYDTALHPENYARILSVWDGFISSAALGGKAGVGVDESQSNILSQHFLRAMEVYEKTKKFQRQRLQSFLDQQVFASAIVSVHGKVLASNEIAKSRLPLKPGDTLYDLQLDTDSLKKFSNSLASVQSNPDAAQPKGLSLRILDAEGTGTLLIAEILTNHGFTDCDEDMVILVKSCLAEWNAAGAGIIQEAFEFTSTEMEVLELVCAGKTANHIATSSGRKLETVRWHTKNLLVKANVKTQSELVRIVTGVLHVCEQSPLTSTQFYVNWKRENVFQRLEKITLKDGRTMQFAHYGHKVGTPILSLHDYTSLPISPRFLVDAMADAGLQIIAPYKSGFGENKPEPGRYDPERHMRDCMEILDHLKIDKIPVVGFGPGGVTALHGAKAFPKRVSKVGLINVGAPLTTEAQYEAMSRNARVIFWTTFHSPELLYAPQTFAADAYFSSAENKRKYIGLALDASPVDKKLIANKSIYKLFEDCLSLALSDPTYQIDEHACLFSDWTPVFDAVLKTTPIHFIQGGEHDFMLRSELEKFRAANPGTSCTVIENAGRLIAYGHPKEFALALKELAVSV